MSAPIWSDMILLYRKMKFSNTEKCFSGEAHIGALSSSLSLLSLRLRLRGGRSVGKGLDGIECMIGIECGMTFAALKIPYTHATKRSS